MKRYPISRSRQAFEALLDAAFWPPGSVNPRKPGALVERMPQWVRDGLRELTSDEVAPYIVGAEQWFDRSKP